MEIRYGLVPDMSLWQTATRLVRDDVLRELTYTGRVLEAPEALGRAVTRIAADPFGAARELAGEIATRSRKRSAAPSASPPRPLACRPPTAWPWRPSCSASCSGRRTRSPRWHTAIPAGTCRLARSGLTRPRGATSMSTGTQPTVWVGSMPLDRSTRSRHGVGMAL